MCGAGECERVVFEDCRFEFADFCGLSLSMAGDCVVRRCDASRNGNTGITLYRKQDCVVEDSRLAFNNYSCFSGGWHAGGMKNIPANYESQAAPTCPLEHLLGNRLPFLLATGGKPFSKDVVKQRRSS
jgi:parallel beta-helix repeat protein